MGQSFAVGGTLGLLLLALPILLAAFVVVWAVRRSKPPPASATRPAQEQAGKTMDMPHAPHQASMAAADAPPPAIVPLVAASARPVPPPAEKALDVAALVQPVAVPDAAAFAAAVTKAEAGGDKAELANLYIKQAALCVSGGKSEEAASLLRDAIRIAAVNKLAAPHALARVELGDLYLSNGDPTTACEQWQIARNLFHDLARPSDRDDVDKRMLGNGCPTDWVLTDF